MDVRLFIIKIKVDGNSVMEKEREKKLNDGLDEF